jgi:hypothetical protein
MRSARRLTLAVALAGALIGALPALALGASGANTLPAVDPAAAAGLPITQPSGLTTAPPGFSSNAEQAITAAEHAPAMIALHARSHPLQVGVGIWEHAEWLVDFSYHGSRVSEVVVSPRGHVTGVWTGPLAIAPYARGDFATLFGSWWILIPFSLAFLIPFLDPRRLWRMRHLDALVLLSFLVSYLLFDHAKLVPAVWMAYPPMLYLLARMLWIGARRAKRPNELPSWLSVRVLTVGLIALVIARIVLSLVSKTVVDVGFASELGAHRIATGQPLYFVSIAHTDTYGPIAYLAYLPFELLFPSHGVWDSLPSVHAASITFDLVTVGGLVALGRRLRAGSDGLRLGLALGWAWAACPFTLLALIMHTNDGLIAMLSVLALVAFGSPPVRGALIGLAAAAKFASAALLPLFAVGRNRRPRDVIVCTVMFAVVVAGSIFPYLPVGGLSEFYNHTIGFQLTRSDVFSPWALHPSLDPLKTVVEVGAVLLCGLVALRPRQRSLAQASALAAAITIAIELPTVHWFYYFIVWFVPFVLVALLAADTERGPSALDAGATGMELPVTPAAAPELVAAG